MFVTQGYEFASDLLEASEQNLDALTAQMKPAESKHLRRQLKEIAAKH